MSRVEVIKNVLQKIKNVSSATNTKAFYLANNAVTSASATSAPVEDKFSHKVVAEVAIASKDDVESAIRAASTAQPSMSKMKAYERREVLEEVAKKLEEEKEHIARIISIEAGKPLKDSLAEVDRAIDTFSISAEEAVRQHGEFLQLEMNAKCNGYFGMTKKFAAGPVSMVAPFNFPLNLVAHKVAPAIAAGCTFVLKPSMKTPLASLYLGNILSNTNLPKGAFSILPIEDEHATPLTEDDRFKVLSFTGSPKVGWMLKSKANKKKVVLELGGNAACIVAEDCKDLDNAAQRILFGAFYYSGQTCISVQRVIVHSSVYDKLKEKLIAGCNKINEQKGDPLDAATFLGPLISIDDAKRVENTVNKAVTSGATIIAGGSRDNAFYDATILENVPENEAAHCTEIFGPVCLLSKYDSFEDAVTMANNSDFGLQCGVFTTNMDKAFYAFNNLEVGGVCINEIPTARLDAQPYGGIKDSGIGREGIKYAMDEFSELKVMLCKDIGNSVV